MPKQSDFDRINQLVVVPLTTFYGAKFPEAFVDAIVEDLSGYSDDTLKAAVLEVRRTCKTTPRIAHLVEACRNAGGTSPHDVADTHDFLAGLHKRDDDARKMTNEFMDHFILSGLAHRARDEGWEGYLLTYARQAAWLQAQFICKVRNCGYSSTPLVSHAQKHEETVKRSEEFVAFCKRQAATGIIEVSVPSYLIDEWTTPPLPTQGVNP